jgi:hypothetical protein
MIKPSFKWEPSTWTEFLSRMVEKYEELNSRGRIELPSSILAR